MVFTTQIFIFYFLPLFLLVYYNLPNRWRNVCITLGSYLFYGWWQPWFAGLMLFTTVLDFFWGKFITRPGATPVQRKLAVAACVVTNLSLLGFFKYYMFAAETLNQILATVGAQQFRVMQVVLPIGISFYTFHSLTYIIDLYRGHATPAKSFSGFSAFVALFPDLVAGPIIRYKTLAEQLREREHTVTRFASGVAIFIVGFAKKILLANPCGQVADGAFNSAHPYALDAWVGVLAYAFQIYFDFCGYSDMAVGLGRMLGFEFPRNFDAPYRSESITELWRRWHISLSNVLRDYLYFALGGNRKGEGRTYINLAVVMVVGGIWHGAKWNFVFWGAFHGLFLALERWHGKRSFYEALPRPGRIGMTFLLMLFSWVLFRADNLTAAMDYYRAMLGMGSPGSVGLLLAATIYTPYHVIILIVCTVLVFQPMQAHDWALTSVTWRRIAVVVPLFILALMAMYTQAFNPFLYFQF
ncbi:MAG: putative alginate O-acetyltransferase [Verrucomicrobiales bacterium]|nr:putative alginate O-acetyltransferase [Verrucomicrobiales bacterium]